MLPIDCESRIERVVVYARGAVVTRKVTLPGVAAGGSGGAHPRGITALAEAGASARWRREREVTAIKARAVIPKAPAKPGRLRERLRELELGRSGSRTRGTSRRRGEPSSRASRLRRSSRGRRARVDPAARFQDALALGGIVAEELRALDDRTRELDAAIEDNQRRLDAAQLEAAQGTPGDLEGEARAALGVQVRLGPAGSLVSLEIDYVVTAARWWPAYTAAHFSAAATRVTLGMDAFVAQATGEAWSGVRALRVATADREATCACPSCDRCGSGGRSAAAHLGYRPAARGPRRDVRGHDRSADRLEISTRQVEGARRLGGLGRRRLRGDDQGRLQVGGRRRVRGTARMPPPPPRAAVMAAKPMAPQSEMTVSASMSMARSMPAPAAVRASVVMPQKKSRAMNMPARAPREEEAGDALMQTLSFGDAPSHAEPASPEGDQARRGLARLRRAHPRRPARAGQPFAARSPHAGRGERDRLARPGGAGRDPVARRAARGRDPLTTRGNFDHRYDAEGSADVPASGRPYRVAIGSAEGEARPPLRRCPRGAAEVYREAEITNPFAAPLLSGPVEVFLDGALLTTSNLTFVDRGGMLHLGLGVEERLRVARNARVEEGSAGLLGGTTTVDHHVTIDVASSLGHPVAIESARSDPGDQRQGHRDQAGLLEADLDQGHAGRAGHRCGAGSPGTSRFPRGKTADRGVVPGDAARQERARGRQPP